MAAVRLSDDLRKSIIDSATNGLSQQIAKIEQEVKAFFPASRLYEFLVSAEERALLKSVPDKYLKRLNHYSVRIDKPIPLGWTVSPAATDMAAYPDSYPTVRLTEENVGEWSILAPLLDRRAKLIAEKIQLKDGLEKLLKGCNGLKQVAELWPTVLMHVPPEVLKKHHEKKTRMKVLPTELNPEVAAALVKSSMLETK